MKTTTTSETIARSLPLPTWTRAHLAFAEASVAYEAALAAERVGPAERRRRVLEVLCELLAQDLTDSLPRGVRRLERSAYQLGRAGRHGEAALAYARACEALNGQRSASAQA